MARKNKVEIPDDLKSKCNVAIHGASAAAAAACAGIAQIPLADNAVLAPIQVGMIIRIASVFDQSIGEGAAQGLLSTFAASFVGRSVTQVLFGWVPFAGNALNSATAAALTEAIGWMAVDHFAKGYQDDQRQKTYASQEEPPKAEEAEKADSAEPKIGKKQWMQQAEEVLAGDTLAENGKNTDQLEKLIAEFERHMDSLPSSDPAWELYLKLRDKLAKY